MAPCPSPTQLLFPRLPLPSRVSPISPLQTPRCSPSLLPPAQAPPHLSQEKFAHSLGHTRILSSCLGWLISAQCLKPPFLHPLPSSHSTCRMPPSPGSPPRPSLPGGLRAQDALVHTQLTRGPCPSSNGLFLGSPLPLRGELQVRVSRARLGAGQGPRGGLQEAAPGAPRPRFAESGSGGSGAPRGAGLRGAGAGVRPASRPGSRQGPVQARSRASRLEGASRPGAAPVSGHELSFRPNLPRTRLSAGRPQGWA